MMHLKVLALGLLLGYGIHSHAQSYSVRTNLIGLATTNLNIEASMTLDKKWSIHLPIQYNPFIFGDRRQFRNLYVAPGARYWFLQSYIGGFVGMYGIAATYSIGNLFGNRHRYEGAGYGMGISIGKAYQLSRKWNVEWEFGAGLSWHHYKKYQCYRCGDLLSHEHQWMFTPTRAALNIVYLF